MPFLSAVASCLFATCMVRVDCAFYIAFLSRFSSRPTVDAWNALVIVMCYLYSTRKFGITYGGKSITIPDAPSAKPRLNPSVITQMLGFFVYSDASWKNDYTYAGYFININNGAVDWSSKLLKVMLSSSECEIASGALAGKRVIFGRNLIGEVFMVLPKLPVTHIIDNSAMPPLTENVGVSKTTEHYRRWMHFLRYLVTHGYSYLHLVKTNEMHANALTKVDNKSAFLAFRQISMNLRK